MRKTGSASAGPHAESPQRISRRRVWVYRGLAVLIPLVLLVVIEAALTAAGVGCPTSFFVPAAEEGLLTTNPWFIWSYRPVRALRPHPQRIAAVKGAETVRVFVLGGSAAMGTPDPAFGFARILELMLQDALPGVRVEVINAAMRGINSHILVDIAEQCAQLEPDLFIVYAGNNELCGRYGPHTFLARHPGLIPVRHWVLRRRLCQLARMAAGYGPAAKREDEPQTVEFFREHRVAFDDARREAVYANFGINLESMCRDALEGGARVLLSTVAVNLRDFAPLGSLHRDGLTSEQKARWQGLYVQGAGFQEQKDFARALGSYTEAAAIDDHHAELQYRMGQCQLALGDGAAARRHFVLARDRDAMAFRTDGRLNEVVRGIGGRIGDSRLQLVDMEEALGADAACADGIAGREYFHDHVHFSFRGDYAAARVLLPAALEAIVRKRGLAAANVESASLEACAERLAFTPFDQINVVDAFANMLSGPPFTEQCDHAERVAFLRRELAAARERFDERALAYSLGVYERAIAARPQDWNLRFHYASMLYRMGRYESAVEHARLLVEWFPEVAPFRALLGYNLHRAGYIDQAVQQYRRALRMEPHDEQTLRALADAGGEP